MDAPADPVQFMLDPCNLRCLTDYCLSDSDLILADMVRAKFENAGLLDALGLIYQPPVQRSTGQFPIRWTAYQIGLFDNGNQNDKRGRARTTKTQFAIDIKVWVAADPDFRASPDWRSTCNFWTPGFARTHVAKLKTRGSLSAEFADTCFKVLDVIDDETLFGIPFHRRAGSGTRYEDDHCCMIHLNEGRPSDATIYVRGITIKIGEFSAVDPSGRALKMAIGAARISRTPLPHWETQTLT